MSKKLAAQVTPSDSSSHSSSLTTTQLYGEKIFTVDYILTKQECLRWIEYAEEKGFKASPPSGGGHGRTNNEAPRTSQFCVVEEPEEAVKLWNVVKKVLPPDLTHIDYMAYIPNEEEALKWAPVGVNPHLRIYKYEKGQRIPKHMDYRMARTVWRGGQKYRQMTFTTLLIYLNADFSGGETGYWVDYDTGDVGTHRKRYCNFSNKADDRHDILIEPKEGRALITDHCIFHEGLPPTKGTKYVIRTDIIHEKQIIIHPKVLENISDKDMKDTVTEWERIFETSCKNYAD